MQENTTLIQESVLQFIKEQILKNGWAPSLREIANEFGWASQTAARCHLIALEKKGKIKRGDNARMIAILESPTSTQIIP